MRVPLKRIAGGHTHSLVLSSNFTSCILTDNRRSVLCIAVQAMRIPAHVFADSEPVFTEMVVGLLQPKHLGLAEYVTFLGPGAHPNLGNEGLREALSLLFSHDGEGKKTAEDHSVAVVVTRPPETYCICRGPDSDTIYMRDSHRRRQFDFDGVASLLEWVRLEKSYFVPQPESPEEFNLIGLYSVTPTVRSGIMRATNQLDDSPPAAGGAHLGTAV
jgi:hypothetical protein